MLLTAVRDEISFRCQCCKLSPLYMLSMVNLGLAYPQYRLLEDLGYIFCEDHEQGALISVPQEVRDIYISLCSDGLHQQKARCDLLHSFIEAAVNLYGIIEQDAFVALFNHYNEDPTTVEELYSCMLRHIAVDASYCLWEKYIVRTDFEENDFQDVRDLVNTPGVDGHHDRATPTPNPLKSYTRSVGPTPSV